VEQCRASGSFFRNRQLLRTAVDNYVRKSAVLFATPGEHFNNGTGQRVGIAAIDMSIQ
jgi:hypothetical protein